MLDILDRMEDPRDPEELMDTEESGTTGGARRPKGLSNSKDPQEPEQMSGLEQDEPTLHGHQRQEGAEALFVMAGMNMEPILPKKMYRRDRNEKEREKKKHRLMKQRQV